jgi:hypothetical protein
LNRDLQLSFRNFRKDFEGFSWATWGVRGSKVPIPHTNLKCIMVNEIAQVSLSMDCGLLVYNFVDCALGGVVDDLDNLESIYVIGSNRAI